MKPANRQRRDLVLDVVATDTTFVKGEVGGSVVWLGKCLHCRAKLVVHLSGETPSGTTVEHIVPQHHGGGDEGDNLALACRRCNNLKGKRIDGLLASDARYIAVIQKLQDERRRRLPRY